MILLPAVRVMVDVSLMVRLLMSTGRLKLAPAVRAAVNAVVSSVDPSPTTPKSSFGLIGRALSFSSTVPATAAIPDWMNPSRDDPLESRKEVKLASSSAWVSGLDAVVAESWLAVLSVIAIYAPESKKPALGGLSESKLDVGYSIVAMPSAIRFPIST
jgi:hypothetical protein